MNTADALAARVIAQAVARGLTLGAAIQWKEKLVARLEAKNAA